MAVAMMATMDREQTPPSHILNCRPTALQLQLASAFVSLPHISNKPFEIVINRTFNKKVRLTKLWHRVVQVEVLDFFEPCKV